MQNQLRSSIASIGALALVAVMQVHAKEAPATQTQPAAEIDPKARRVLRDAADYFAGIKAFRVTDHRTVTMLSNGTPQELRWVATLAMQRPDRFALRDEGGLGLTTVSDGRSLYRYKPDSQRYSVQEVTEASLEKLKHRMAAAGVTGATAASVLIADQPYEAFVRSSSKVAYVGTATISGIACERLRFTLSFATYANIDMWIQTGQQPVPVKIMRTNGGPGAPRWLKDRQMETVDILKDWSIVGELPAAVFQFQPPAGAAKVPDGQLFTPPGPHPLVGKTAPDVMLELLDGGKLNLAEHVGKHVVILAFGDPEFPLTAKYLPKVAEVAQSFEPEGVRFYAVCPAESREAAREFLAAARPDIPVALDPKGQAAKKYGLIDVILSTVMIDKKGKVQVVEIGFERGDTEQLREQIRAVLDGKDLAAEALAK